MTDTIYIFMRRDLNMRRGKEIAQAAHAVLGLGVEDGKIVTLKVTSEDLLIDLQHAAAGAGRKHCLVRDAGRTEVPAGTPTCIAIIGGKYTGFDLY